VNVCAGAGSAAIVNKQKIQQVIVTQLSFLMIAPRHLQICTCYAENIFISQGLTRDFSSRIRAQHEYTKISILAS